MFNAKGTSISVDRAQMFETATSPRVGHVTLYK